VDVTRKLVFSVFLAACAAAASSQTPVPAKEAAAPCLSIRISIDDASLKDPITLLVGHDAEIFDVPLTGECFHLPQTWLEKKEVAVRIDAGNNSLLLGTLSTDTFDCPWDIWLSNKRGTTKAGKFHYKNSTSCRIEFKKGEPGTGMVISSCRVARKPSLTPNS
jgi:hypothetical protein